MKKPRFSVVIAALALSLFVMAASAGAQEMVRGPVALPSVWTQGFGRAVSGELLIYTWAYPGQTKALLSRTTDGRMVVEWETDPPPPGPADEPVTFLWHAGLASGYGAHHFTLSVNGTPCATFTSSRDANDREWTLKGDWSAVLSFKTTRVGTFNELFGLMMLTVPRRMVAAGPPRLRVVGEAADNRDYYMTFQERVETWTRARAEQAVFKDGRRAVRVEMSRAADAADASVRAGGTALWSGRVQPGYTSIMVPIPAGTVSSVALVVEVDGRAALTPTLALPPVRPWEIHLLPHSHVDIGYSDPQPVVERKQWQNLRDAVALAAKTASYPTDARFRWNVEGLWSVESYLQQATPEEQQAFVAAVKQGSIGMQANYTNILTGLAGPEELAHWTDGARRLAAKYGLPPMRSAMHTDIPGLSWTVVTALAQAGVRYFSSGPNYMPGLPDRGDRIGHTLDALGDKPCWWVSSSGQEKLLFWMAGRGYSWFHGLNMGRMRDESRQALLDYLSDLAGSGYAYDLVQVRYTIGGDNGPVDPQLPDVVRAWNETFSVPRLVISTAEGVFAEMEKRHGAQLPVVRGDMTPYWEDGAVSSVAEEAMVRASAWRLAQAGTVWSLTNPAGFPAADAAEAWRQVTLWHEHTWGAADSISEPDRKDVVDQWLYKRAFAIEADRRSKALVDAARPKAGSAVDVVNTLNWDRGGLVVVPADVAAGRTVARDAQGRDLPTQRLVDGSLAVWTPPVPQLGALRLSLGESRSGGVIPAASPRGAAAVAGVKVTPLSLDNGRVRVVIDQATGAITSLTSAATGAAELVKAGSPGLNAYLYVPGRDPSQARSNGTPRITIDEPGPLVGVIRIESDAPGAKGLVRRVRLVLGSDEIEIEDVLDKTLVREKESAHIAFPFDMAGGAIRVDEGSSVVGIERDQLPGSCKDFIGAQSAIDVSNARVGISLATIDAPLVEIGAMTDERAQNGQPRAWRTSAAPGTTVYAYLLNNYWHTNYKADQSGELRFWFVLKPHGSFDPVALRRFGASQEQPLLVFAADASAPPVAAPFRVEGAGIVVSSVEPAAAGGGGLLVRLYNASSTPSSAQVVARVVNGVVRVWRADADGRAGAAVTGRLTLPAYGSVVVRVQKD
jgi:hypothetical protein